MLRTESVFMDDGYIVEEEKPEEIVCTSEDGKMQELPCKCAVN